MGRSLRIAKSDFVAGATTIPPPSPKWTRAGRPFDGPWHMFRIRRRTQKKDFEGRPRPKIWEGKQRSRVGSYGLPAGRLARVDQVSKNEKRIRKGLQ